MSNLKITGSPDNVSEGYPWDMMTMRCLNRATTVKKSSPLGSYADNALTCPVVVVGAQFEML